MAHKDCRYCVDRDICPGLATCRKCGHKWCDVERIDCPVCGDDGESVEEDE